MPIVAVVFDIPMAGRFHRLLAADQAEERGLVELAAALHDCTRRLVLEPAPPHGIVLRSTCRELRERYGRMDPSALGGVGSLVRGNPSDVELRWDGDPGDSTWRLMDNIQTNRRVIQVSPRDAWKFGLLYIPAFPDE